MGRGRDGEESAQSSLGRLRALQRDLVQRRRHRTEGARGNGVAAAEAVVPKPSQKLSEVNAAPVGNEVPALQRSQTGKVSPGSEPVTPKDSEKLSASLQNLESPVKGSQVKQKPAETAELAAISGVSAQAASIPTVAEGSSGKLRETREVRSPISVNIPFSSSSFSQLAPANTKKPTTTSKVQKRDLSNSRSTSGGMWLIRTGGALPTLETSSAVKDEVLDEAERIWIPTLNEAMGLSRLETLARDTGNLPRLTAEMSNRAAKATAESMAESETRSALSSSGSSRSSSEILASLNKPQQRAVVAEPGRPCLVLAGPGSGKTRVLTHRAAYLVREIGVSPHRVLAVTFTNKAAGEMKERIDKLLDDGSGNLGVSGDMVVGTFHAICARFLRMHGSGINILANFDIADTTDARSVLSELMKEKLGAEYSSELVRDYTRKISMIKNERGDELEKSLPGKEFSRVSEMRKIYDDKMRSMNKLDFDDLLVDTRRLLNECIDVRHLLQTRFHHVLVDEWQDTNTVQYDIVSILTATHRNLFVVGDGDQSIYKFRGADSRNVDRFGVDFEDAHTVALVENYRSTKCIVQAAQAVIEKNKNRPGKEMMTSNHFGDLIDLVMCEDGADEVYTVVQRLRQALRLSPGGGYSDVAILYRTNAQSRLFEEACVKSSIPYRLVGGTRFYERQEIKDLLAYLRLLRNPLDDTSLKRAINTPPRGIGEKTVETLENFAAEQGLSMMAALDDLFGADADDDGSIGLMKGASKKRLAEFYEVIKYLRDSVTNKKDYTVESTLSFLVEKIKYAEYSAKIGGTAAGAEKASERWRNVIELLSAASRYDSLDEFMESVALVSDVKDVDDGTGNVVRPQAVSLMTLHGGKGLEFDHVFIAGMEEGQVPMVFNRDKSIEALEEERRLAYVGMTRARKFLHLSWRRRKLVMRAGKAPFYADTKRSRFLGDIPDLLVNDVPSSKAKANLWRSQDDSDKGSSGKSTTVWKSAKKNSTVTSYSSSGSASKLAAPYAPRVNEAGQAGVQKIKIGDSVRENTGNTRGVVIATDKDSPIVEVLFANGQQRAIPKTSCTVMFAV